eukprot:g2531.t1
MVRLVQPPLSAHGRLSGAVIQALAIDDVGVLHAWLQDAATHVEDTSDDANKRQTAVMWCARNGSGRCLRVLLEVGAETNAAMLDVGATALYLATQNGHEQCARLLVNAGANPNIARNTGTTPLAVAAKQNHFQIVYLLIQAGAKLDAATVAGATPLLVAAKAGSAESLTQLIRAGANVRCRASDGLTPLIAAAMSGCRKCIAALLDADVDVNARLPEGATAIFTLARRGDADSLSATAEAGADVNVRCRDGSTALIVAAQQGHAKCLQVLLRAGADVDAALNIGATALYVASQEGFCACVQVLLESGAKPNKARTTGGTALYAAGQQGHHGCVEKLLQAGAHATSQMLKEASAGHTNTSQAKPTARLSEDVMVAVAQDEAAELAVLLRDGKSCGVNDFEPSKRQTALILAARHGSGKSMQVIIDAGADLEQSMVMRATALYIATQQGYKGCMHLLLNAGANPNVSREGGISPLYIAAQKGREDCVELLLASGANVNSAKQDLTTVLHCVTQAGLTSGLRQLLQAGAHADIVARDGTSALHIAALAEDVSCLQVLVDAGATCNVVTAQGISPLYVAAKAGNSEALRVLLGARANPNIARRNGSTPLMAAVHNGSTECTELLLDEGAVDPNITTREGVSALLVATQCKNYGCMQALLDRGAKAEFSDLRIGSVHIPLLTATESEDEQAVGILVRAGCNVNAANLRGLTALAVAVRRGNGTLVKLFLGAGADVNTCNSETGTPLIVAAQEGRADLLMMLLAAGSTDVVYNPSPDSPLGGRTALDFALQGGGDKKQQHSMVQLLRDAGAVAPSTEPVSLVGKSIPVAQAIASNHASALINLLQNGAELPPDVRADATVLLEKAEEVELRAKQAQVDEWEQRRELAARKAADEAAAVETARTAAADADMNMVASARLATAAKLVVPDVSAANARVSEGQARVAKLAGQLSEEQGAVQSLQLEEAKAFALDAEVKQDHAKRETAQHDKKCEQASAAKTRLENAEVLLVATESSLVEVQKGLKESIAAQDVAQVALQRMQGCMQRLGKDLDPAAVVGLLLEMPMCYAVQRAGLGLLLGVAKVPEHANTINAHNGQQALLFNIFRQLLGEEIEQLRELLAATRLGAIAKASEAMDTAISITSALAMVAVLCDEDIANEPLLQLRGMRALLTLFEEHQTAVQQLEDEPDERQRLRLRVERVQRDCPLALELCAAATRVAEFMDAFDKLNAAQDIAAIVAALSSVNTPRHRLCGLLEIAEWIARADTEAGGKHRWLVEHFDTMIEHGVTSIAQAKQLIEDYGDLREWKIPKVAAKALFTSLEALLLELL